MEIENQEAVYLPFSFEGSGKEYFRIWIVNIALTILTLGIYSAWAKVRTNRYFYANTYLNGSNFEYNADPVRILIGRIIVFGGYVSFILFFEYLGMVEVAGTIALIGFLAIPWLIRQAVSFKLRNTSYRNVPFRYTGKTWDFYKFFIFNTFLFIIPVGVTSALGIPLIPMILIFLLTGYIYVQYKALIIGHAHYGDGDFYFTGESSEIYGIYMKITGWMLLLVIGAILGMVMLGSVFSEIIEELLGMMPLLASLLPVVMVVVYLSIVFFQKGLSDAYHANFVRNNTKLNQAPLKGEMKPLMLAWISVTNVLALVFSLGLLHPWAKVRYMRYKLEHTYFRCEDYGQFTSHGYVQGSTIGEETVDFFDVDVGL